MIAANPLLRDPRGGLDFLGPEFLTWLWWRAAEAPRFVHADGTEVFVHFDEHLEFRGERSAARRTVLRTGMPGGSAEARAALRSGKTLVAARLLLVRGEEERRLTVRAEDLDLSGLKLPASEAGSPAERLEDGLEALDRAQDDLDLCFLTFLEVRCGTDWPAEVARIRAFGAGPSEDERIAGAAAPRGVPAARAGQLSAEPDPRANP
jgi:hypothetical protein